MIKNLLTLYIHNWLILIGAPKMRNNDGVIQLFFLQYCKSNIEIFSIAHSYRF